MPRGKFVNHKGRNRHFTSPEELEEERKRELQKKWRKKKEEGEDSDSESGSGDEEEAGSNESEEDESESEDDGKRGAHGLIEIENPNRIQKKAVLKVSTLDAEVGVGASSSTAAAVEQKPAAAPELSRREREEIEKQKRQANYQKLHAQGKTEQARADLARLAIIKQQREEAARARENKKKDSEAKTKGGK